MPKRLPALAPLLVLLAAAAPATKPAPAEETFVVFGRVVDGDGKPIANAQVSARCGAAGTLVRTGTVRTGKDGAYRLAFEPGVHYERALGQEVAGFQDALISVYKGGHVEKNLGRGGDLAMTDDPPDVTRPEAANYAGVVRAGRPYRLDFVLVPAAKVEGRLVAPDGTPHAGVPLSLAGPDLPPNQSTLASTKTDDAGRFTFPAVPTGYAWTLTLRGRPGVDEVRSAAPITLDKPKTAAVVATYDPDKGTLAAGVTGPATHATPAPQQDATR